MSVSANRGSCDQTCAQRKFHRDFQRNLHVSCVPDSVSTQSLRSWGDDLERASEGRAASFESSRSSQRGSPPRLSCLNVRSLGRVPHRLVLWHGPSGGINCPVL